MGGVPGLPGLEGGGAAGRPYCHQAREHLEVCKGYAFLRAGKDLCVLSEQTKYFMAVMVIRSKK